MGSGIAADIKIIEMFKLDRLQAALLCCFPQIVIDYAVNKLNTVDTKNYHILYKACMDYCIKNNIDPDYAFAKRVSDYTKMQLAKGNA